MQHSFDIDIAGEIGINAAVIFNNFCHWLTHHNSNELNIKNGRSWICNSQKALQEIFPYLTEKQIRNAIDMLIEKKYLEKAKFGDKNNTLWYSWGEKTADFRFALQGKPFALQGKPNSKKSPYNILYINNNKNNKDINNININHSLNKDNNKYIEHDILYHSYIGDESVDLIDEIVRIYPKRGFTTVDGQIAIANAIVREMEKGKSEHDTVDIIRTGTMAYINAVKKWKPKDKKFITNIKNFFNNSMYLEDAEIWEREENERNAGINLYVPTN